MTENSNVAVVHEAKNFRVVAISQTTNSFGLRGHILVAEDGEAWEVGRSIADPVQWARGADVAGTRRPWEDHWTFIGCELPRRLPNAPTSVLREVFPGKSSARASA